MQYTLLDSDDKIKSFLSSISGDKVLSVDIECEFNLHVYGEHLCLVQIYDGKDYFIIDPLSNNVTEDAIKDFFTSTFQKLWFDTGSDQSLIYKNYGIKINNVYDIRVLAVSLGEKGNLLSLINKYLSIDIHENKKKNQMENWMIRPLSEKMIEYALQDTSYLFSLKDILYEKCKEKKLLGRVKNGMNALLTIKESRPGWERIGVWKHYKKDEKERLKAIFLSRDEVARYFNVPPAKVMSKEKIQNLTLFPPKSKEELHKRLYDTPSTYREMLYNKIWESIS